MVVSRNHGDGGSKRNMHHQHVTEYYGQNVSESSRAPRGGDGKVRGVAREGRTSLDQDVGDHVLYGLACPMCVDLVRHTAQQSSAQIHSHIAVVSSQSNLLYPSHASAPVPYTVP